MEVVKFDIDGLLVLTPTVYEDERGFFYESFNQERFNELVGKAVVFKQDNQSLSKKNVLRGFHFQAPPYAQGKLVRVVKGSVLDIAIDIRKASPTYGQSVAVELSAENKKMFWIPEGFAHGFYTLEEDTIFLYKCTNLYHKASEGDLLWSDQHFEFHQQFLNPIVSEKDQIATPFNRFESPF